MTSDNFDTANEALRVCMMYFGAVGILERLIDFVDDVPEYRDPITKALVQVRASDPPPLNIIKPDN